MTLLTDHSKKWLAFIGIALLSFGCYLDYTVVNIALPTIQQDLQTDLLSLQWIMNIYFLALCVFAAIMGQLGDLFGRRRCFYLGISIFGIASLIAGFAFQIEWLIFGRLLQGLGAAIVLPLGPSLLPQSFPENERAKSIAWLGSVGGMALALGPVLGGIIVTYWGWRWIFFINIPIIIVGYLFCLNSVKESPISHETVKLDWFGMLFLALTMGGIVLSLIHSQTYGWNNRMTLIYLIVGIASFFILFKIENKLESPLIDFKDFTQLLFFGGAILCFLSGVLSAVALFFDPLYLQIIRSFSPETAGYILFAIPIAVVLVAFLVGQLIFLFGIINTIVIGLFLGVISALLHAFFIVASPLWYVVIAFLCLGSTWAMGNTVSLIAGQTAAGSHRASVATGTIVTMFNIGGSIGLAISVVVYQWATSTSLQHIFMKRSGLTDHHQFDYLTKLIANPSHSLTESMNSSLRHLFNEIFMQGFSSVMWFLFIITIISLVSVLVWKIYDHFISNPLW